MLTQEEIYRKVSATLAEALNVDEDDIQPTATLQGDLGADSLDLLEIMFRLEREFGIEVLRGELFPQRIFRISPELVQDGKLTEKGLEELHARMPFADLGEFAKNRQVSHIGDLLTVDLIARYVQGKVATSNS